MIKNLLTKQPKKYAVYGLLTVAIAALLLGNLISRPVAAQKGGSQKPTAALVPTSLPANRFAKSINARDLPIIDKKRTTPKDGGDEDINQQNTRQIRKAIVPGKEGKPDGALQNRTPNAVNVIPGPSLQFAGRSGATAGVAPPDTVGDIGPNHYVQATNDSAGTVIQVFNPTTGASVAGPFTLGSLFPVASFASLNGGGDPIVLYDQMADRWLIAEFSFVSVSSPPYHMSIVISQTADPTGAYFLYDFILPGNEFPDYPHLGVWPDGYYMTTNQFTLGGAFNGGGAFAFNRTKMIAGDPTANLIYFSLNLTAFPEAVGGMLPSDADGLTPPPAGAPNVFMYFTAAEFGDPADGLRAFNFTADFVTPMSSTFVERAESTLAVPIAVAAFDPISPSGRSDVPQLGTASGLDSISDRLMHRLQYRNFGTHEAWAASHTVDASGNPAAATFQGAPRYYELRRTTGNANPISVNNQATFAPDTTHRWMGSAAMDSSGNLAVGYSASSSTINPQIRWAGRLVGTAAGLGEGEATMFSGTGSQSATGNRWGDYSAMSVDPDNDCAFWYTQEHYDTVTSFDWRTRIGTFTFPSCTPPAQGTVSGQIVICGGGPLANALLTFTGGPSSGFSVATDAAGNFSRQLSPGTYTVTITAPNFGTVTTMATVTNGGTVTVNNCLAGAPSINAAGATIVTEGCAPANGAVDPSETVTVSLCVQNTGGANTTALMGTLQATGGVTSPSGPQNYGVVVAGGAAVCQNFTFTASGACGGMITASLDLQDGGTPLGTVTYTFQLGVQAIALSENFDGVTAPALPAGWVGTRTAGDGDCTAGGALCALGANWVTSATTPDTAPNAAFHDNPSCVTDNTLDTPSMAITSAAAQVTFRHNFNVESNFDGGVLEVSSPNINAGAFTDITNVAVGGSFVTGGYTGTINTGATDFFNPLRGRMAWTGDSAGYITTTANLGPNVMGQTIVLRFRLGTDCSVNDVGWRIDTISVSNGFACCVPMGACTSITCPANVTVSNDVNQCGAVVTYPAPTPVGSCGTITCSPASGSFFPVGTTTVTCTSSAGPTCNFTVTVNDTQPPTITCPTNIVAVAAPACPAPTTSVTTFAAPVATDNCPGVTVACVPASGTVFPIGTTTVTCTATDATGNTATCSFTIKVFNVCVQDRSNPTSVLAWNTTTGEYVFCCNGSTFTGVGKVKRTGCTYTLDHTPADRRVTGKVDFSTFRGEGALQIPTGTTRCTISDNDVRNNDCSCIGGGGGPSSPSK